MPNNEEPFEAELPPDTARRVRKAVHAERERIAKLLHATACQDLTGGYLMICATAIRCRKLAPELGQKLDAVAERLQKAGEGLRELLRSLQSEEQAPGDDS